MSKTSSALGRELFSLTEDLVDAISDLSIAAITGDFGETKKLAGCVAQSGQKLLVICTRVATLSGSPEFQNEIVEAVNGLTNSIKGLVVAFVALGKDRENHSEKKKFAAAVKSLGEAISNLVMSTDETSPAQFERCINACKSSREKFISVCEHGCDMNVFRDALGHFNDKFWKIEQMSHNAAEHTLNNEKREAIASAIGKLTRRTDRLISTAQELQEGVGTKDDVTGNGEALDEAFDELLAAIKLPSDIVKRMHTSYEKLLSLIEALRNLFMASAELFLTANHAETTSIQEKCESLRNALSQVRKQAGDVGSTSMHRHEQIERVVSELTEAVSDLVAEANKGKGDSPHLSLARDRVVNALSQLFVLSGSDPTLATAVGLLNSSGESLVDACKSYLQGAINALSSKELGALCDKATDIAEDVESVSALCAETLEKASGERVAALGKEISDIVGDSYIDAVEDLWKDPSDAKAKKAADALFDKIVNLLEELKAKSGDVKASAGTTTAIKSKSGEGWPDISPQSGESDLVRAAKEEVAEAKQMAEEAALHVSQSPDDDKKHKTLAAVTEVQACARSLMDITHTLSKTAGAEKDAAAQKFAEAQRQLASHVQTVVNLTTENVSTEIADAMKAVNAAAESHSVSTAPPGSPVKPTESPLQKCEAILQQLEALVKDYDAHKDPQKCVDYAKSITALTKSCYAELVQIAKTVEEKELKSELTANGKIVKDIALQIKIVSVVQASAGGAEGSDDPVGAAVHNLSIAVRNLSLRVLETSLRAHVRAAREQSNAISNLTRLWRNELRRQSSSNDLLIK